MYIKGFRDPFCVTSGIEWLMNLEGLLVCVFSMFVGVVCIFG